MPPFPLRPLARRRGRLQRLLRAHLLRLRHPGPLVRSAHLCRDRVSPCVPRRPALRAQLAQFLLHNDTRPLHLGPLAQASVLVPLRACARRERPNPIALQARPRVVPVAHPVKAAGQAARHPVFRSAQALAVPAVVTTKLPWAVNVQVRVFPRPNPANRSMPGSPRPAAAGLSSRSVTPKASASYTRCVRVPVPVQVAVPRRFNP